MAKKTKTQTDSTAPRKPGREANFPPDVATKARLYHLPVETIGLIEQEAANRGEPIGRVVDALIRRGVTRRKSKATA